MQKNSLFFIGLLLFTGITMAEPFDFSITLEPHTIKTAEFVEATDSIGLAYYAYVPAEPKAAIIFNHGSGAWSCGEYQTMAKELSENYNVATYLVDRRGHGNSQGPRGDAPSTQQVWQDLDTIIDFVKEKHPHIPLLLAGHSSGAGLILGWHDWPEHTNSVDGYIFIAPFLGVTSGTLREITDPEKAFIKHARVWALIGHAMSKGWLFAHTPALFFNYPEWVLKKDEHILTYYTTAMASSDHPQQPKTSIEHLDKPFAIFVGGQDELFLPEEVVKYASYSEQSSISEIVPQAKHLSIIADAPALCARAVNELIDKQ